MVSPFFFLISVYICKDIIICQTFNVNYICIIIDKNVSNVHAFQTLLEAFTHPHSQRRPSTTSSASGSISSGKQSPLSAKLKRKIFMEMKHIIQMSPVNYFTLERTNTVPLLIESMESYDVDIQVKLLFLFIIS